MFKFETSSTLIKTIITCLKEFVDSIELTIDSTGIHISTLDEAHVCMIQFYISKQECSIFEVQKTTKVGFTINILDKVLKNAKKEITLSVDSTNSYLLVEYNSKSRIMKYKIPCKSNYKQALILPQNEYIADISFESKTLADICTEVKNVSEECSVQINPSGKFSFYAKDEIMGEAKIELTNSVNFKNSKINDYKVKFQVEYLSKICKIAKKMKDVKIQVPGKNGDPMNFGFTTDNGSQLDFILATKF